MKRFKRQISKILVAVFTLTILLTNVTVQQASALTDDMVEFYVQNAATAGSIEGATITVYDGESVYATLTSLSGIADLNLNTDTGSLRYVITAPGFVTLNGNLSAFDMARFWLNGDRTIINLQPEGSVYHTIRVLDGTNPVRDAQITISGTYMGTTNAAGEYFTATSGIETHTISATLDSKNASVTNVNIDPNVSGLTILNFTPPLTEEVTWIEISTKAELLTMSGNLTGNYRLTANINLEGADWTPFGAFSGTFDGNGKVISNFTIIDTASSNKGFFSSIEAGAVVKNLGIEGANITAGDYAGVLAGVNKGTISKCYAKGSITGNKYVGGLVGENQREIYDSYASVQVNGQDYMGGLVGINSMTVERCYSTSQVSPSKLNYYLEFDGIDDYIKINHNSAYEPALKDGVPDATAPYAFTLEAWFQWNLVNNPNDDIQFIIGKGFEQFEIHTEGMSGANGVRFIPILNTEEDSWLDVPNVIKPGWFHVAAVYWYEPATETTPGKAKARMYVNGVAMEITQNGNTYYEATINRDTNPLSGNIFDLNIGRRSTGGSYFNGKIADVRIWNTARNGQQILENMYKVLSGANEQNLVGYWKLNEPEAGAKDSSLIGNNGELMGGLVKTSLTGVNIGGLIGANTGTVTNSYYDSDVSGMLDTGNGIPTVTSEMKKITTTTSPYNTWDFSGVWDINAGINDGYPYLKAAAVPSITVQPSSASKYVDETETFAVTAAATDGGSIGYQWQKSSDSGTSWSNILSATSDTYTTGELTLADNGTQYRCAVTNSLYGISTRLYTDMVTLTVNLHILTAATINITAPAAGVTPQSASDINGVTNSSDFTVSGVAWNEELTVDGKFKTGQTYTANVTLTSKPGKAFQTAGFIPVVAGAASIGTTLTTGIDSGNTVSFTVTYGATVQPITGITLKTEPTKLSYTEGEALQLTGLAVTLTYSDGSTKDVAYEDFAANSIITSPANETALVVTTHNVQPVTLTCSGTTVKTNNLTVNYAANTPFYLGNALHYSSDGDDTIYNSQCITTQIDNLTMETWVKADTLSDSLTNIRIMYNGNSGQNGYGIYLTGANKNPAILMGKLFFVSPETPVTLNKGQWYHLAAVRDNGTWKLYINGEQKTLGTGATTTPYTPNGEFSIGNTSIACENFTGSIDESRFWTVARTSQQIKDNMYVKLKGNEGGLLAYYSYDQGIAGGNNTSITSLIDVAGRDHNLTVSGFTLNNETSNFVNSVNLGQFQFENSSYTIKENASPVKVAITRTGGSEGEVTINYNTTNGTAIAGINYTDTKGSVKFAAGELRKEIDIPIISSGITSTKNLFMTLSAQTGVPLGGNTSTTINLTSDTKSITAFNLNGLSPAVVGTVNEDNHTIGLTVPYGTNVTSLVPTITYSGSSVSPNSGVAVDFTNPVTYRVTAVDGATQDYVVTITVAAPKLVTGIAVKTQPKLNYIAGEALDLSNLVATLTYNDGTTKDVAYIDFEGNSITTSPTNGTTMLVATHNGQAVTLTCNTNTATTGNLLVKVIYIPTPVQEILYTDITDGTQSTIISEIKIGRTTELDGTKKDVVIYEDSNAKETVDKLMNQGQDTAIIIIPDVKDEIKEARIDIPQTTLDILSQGKINLEIQTENARINLPKESIKDLSEKTEEDLFFRVVPIKTTKEIEEVEKRAKQDGAILAVTTNNGVSVVGRPMEIETNMSGRKVDIILPLKDMVIPTDVKEREKFLKSLAVFIEHSDGDKELKAGEIVEYKDGVLGIKFTITKFSTFTIIKLSSPLPSYESEITSVKSPQGAVITGSIITKTFENNIEKVSVDLAVSDKANWKLYKDFSCTVEIPYKNMSLKVGENISYIKVKAEDGKISKVYTLKLTRKNNPQAVKSVVIGTKAFFADGFAGEVLAAKLGGRVVLLGKTNKELQSLISYITKNFTTKDVIYILGGKLAYKTDPESILRRRGYTNIVRIAGGDKYDTAKRIAERISPVKGTPVVLVNGAKTPKDAEYIKSFAIKNGYSILYVTKGSLTKYTIAALQKLSPSKVYLAGDKTQTGDKLIIELQKLLKLKTENIIRIKK